MLRTSLLILGALVFIITGISSADTGKHTDFITPAKPIQVKASRGQLLYGNHCHAGHESIVHIRKQHKVRSVADIYYWVTRWSYELKLQWSKEEIDDVVGYLNSHYYKFTAK